MNMAKKAGNALLRATLGPVGEAAVKAVTGGAYDVLTRSDNKKNASMVEKANNDKSVTENYSMTKASYGKPREQWRNKSINPQESLKVELKARERGYVPPAERNKPKEESIGRSKDTGRSKDATKKPLFPGSDLMI